MDVPSWLAAQEPPPGRVSADAPTVGIRQGPAPRARHLFVAGRLAHRACRSAPMFHPDPRGPPRGA